MSDYIVVIPGALRVNPPAGKPLLDIGGKPMIVRVAEQAAKSRGAARSGSPPIIMALLAPWSHMASIAA